MLQSSLHTSPVNEDHLEQVRIQHQPRDSHFSGLVHLGPDHSADDPPGMD